MQPNTAQEYIGHVEAMAANVLNPFDKDALREELIADINLRHLPDSEAEKVKKHYENMCERSSAEKEIYVGQQLEKVRPGLAHVWGRMLPGNVKD